MFSCCLRPKKVENEDEYSFTFGNRKRPVIGTAEAKSITKLLDAPGVSVVATKEFLCSPKPNLLIFSIIPVDLDEGKNNAYVASVQNFVSAFMASQLRICLFFVQLKAESSLVDTSVYSFGGLSTSDYKSKKGYESKVPISSSVVLEMLKDMCVKTKIPPERVILMGRASAGCLVLNIALSAYNRIKIGGYCCIDTYLPRNFSLYSQLSESLLDKPLFMSNSISPENVPSNWGNETFSELRHCGLRPSSSCFFSIRSKANNYWDYMVDWIVSYVQPRIEGKKISYRRGRRVSWAPDDVLEDYIEYEVDSDTDDYDYHSSESLQSLVVGF